jgi:UDP-N-acetylmuramoyl-L-alanine---L-glutamate ligase
MRVADLGGRRVAVWGLGREGRAAIHLLRRQHPGLPLIVLDDNAGTLLAEDLGDGINTAFGPAAIGPALDRVDVLVKSPGVSLYRPELMRAKERGVYITSLLNLWFAEPHEAVTVCVTGTKGKGTTASLIAHILRRLGRRPVLAGNIGVAIDDVDTADADIVVIEMSSYQCADFDGLCDVAVLTALYPEHLDWHGSLDAYYRDKIHLLGQSRCGVVNAEAAAEVRRLLPRQPPRLVRFNDPAAIHAQAAVLHDGASVLGAVRNPYLARSHNRSNLCAALTVAREFGFAPGAALAAAEDFEGLPHRQQELGTRDDVLYVDDSISTTPESTLAALAAYAGRPVSVIVGGFDRGIDYGKLVAGFAAGAAAAVVCLGDSGARIFDMARREAPALPLFRAATMKEAVARARALTTPGGVVLLSPAAPSYGQYRDYIERGIDFARECGLPQRQKG